MGKDVMKWLQEVRGLDGVLMADMKVQAANHPKLGPVVAFPYAKSGKAYAAKFRSEDKRWSSTAGVTRGLYNADALSNDPEQPIVITEGEIDCLSVMQSGFTRAVSLPDGWTEQGNKTESLVEAEEALRRSPFVIVAGDNDKAGESLPRAVANILKGHDVRTVTWPDGCKDANDVLVSMGEGEVSACLNRAKRIDPPGGFITGFSDLPPLSDRRVLRTGDELLDGRLAFEVGAMSVGTGTPGAGKSTLTTYAAYHVAMNENIRVGFMSFETHAHRTRDHLARLYTGRPFDSLAGIEVKQFNQAMDAHFRLVHRTYGDRGHNLGWLESMVYTLAVRDQCKLIVIDPWNELEHQPEPGENLTAYINFALQQIRQWAESLEVHICVVAHPKKIEVSSQGQVRAPLGYDVADSAAFNNKPSLGFTVHQDTTENGAKYVQLITWKVRDTQLYGIQKGCSDATFDIDRMNYTGTDLGGPQA